MELHFAVLHFSGTIIIKENCSVQELLSSTLLLQPVDRDCRLVFHVLVAGVAGDKRSPQS